MKIRLQDGLPFISVALSFAGRTLVIDDVLLDTGSAGTIFSADRVSTIGLEYAPDDRIRRIRGVGGTEFVFNKQVNQLAVADLAVSNFEVEIGVMDYGFEFGGIVGVDFLLKVGAVVDLSLLEIRRSETS